MYIFEEHLLSLSYLKLKFELLPLQRNVRDGAVLPPPLTPRHMIYAIYVVLFYNYLYWQCIVVLKTQLIKIIISHFGEKFEKFCKFPLKICIFCNTYLVDKVYN